MNYEEMELYELFEEKEKLEEMIEAEDNKERISVLVEEMRMIESQVELLFEEEFWGGK